MSYSTNFFHTKPFKSQANWILTAHLWLVWSWLILTVQSHFTCSIAACSCGHHVGRYTVWPHTGEFGRCCSLEREPGVGESLVFGHFWWVVTVHQPSVHLPLETGINLQRALIIVYPGPDCCVLRALQALSHSLLRTIWRFFLLPLGNKRLCKLPKVRELLNGSARIQNQFRLTLEFVLLLDVLYPVPSLAPPPPPRGPQNWMAAPPFSEPVQQPSLCLSSMPFPAYSPGPTDSAWLSRHVL